MACILHEYDEIGEDTDNSSELPECKGTIAEEDVFARLPCGLLPSDCKVDS
jgi:hypothetical protein